MSTKIYNGLIATEASLRGDVFAFADQLREVLEKTFFTELDRALDNLGELAPQGPFAVCDRLIELDRTATHTFDPLDLMYQAMVFPPASRPLVLVFGEKSDRYRRALLEAGLVVDYGYWDNSDPEDGITERQWDQRHDDWGKALSRQGEELFGRSPSETGLQINPPHRYQVFTHLNDKDGS